MSALNEFKRTMSTEKIKYNSSLYLESTIPSYLVARQSRDIIIASHQQITQEWWSKRKNDFEIFVSIFVKDEVSLGNKNLAQQRLEVISKFPMLEVTKEVEYLSARFLDGGVIPKKAGRDATHIAISAVHGIEFLMTWNCKHIANASIIRRLERICIEEGYLCPIICTPEELLER